MIGSYYFWKWADNDLPGRPREVHAALLRGEMHPALQTFDARPLLKKLERIAVGRRLRGEEWDWDVAPRARPQAARFVFVSSPPFDRRTRNSRPLDFSALGLSGIDEESGCIIRGLPPKLNCFHGGQLYSERLYDITEEELPALLHGIMPRLPDPFAILEGKRLGDFVQCCAHGRRFCVEWAHNGWRRRTTVFDQWRAQDSKRLAAMGGVNDERTMDESETPDLVTYSDTLRIFRAFLRREPRPPQYAWRNINHIVS